MKINWKQVAKSPGYKSLKDTYIRAVREAAEVISRGHKPMRDKAEFLKHFNWIIHRAQHYAHHQGTSIEVILIRWEEQRKYCWLNFYQDYRQPKLGNTPHKWKRYPSIKRMRKKAKDANKRWGKSKKRNNIGQYLIRKSQAESTKKKPRWTMIQKKRKRR